MDGLRKYCLVLFSALLTAAAAYILVTYLFGLLFPFIIAFAIAWILNRPIDRISKKLRLKRSPIAVIVILLFYILICSLIGFCAYKLVTASASYIGSSGEILVHAELISDEVKSTADKLLSKLPEAVSDFLRNTISDINSSIRAAVTQALASIAKGAAAFAVKFTVALILIITATIYFSVDYSRLRSIFCGLISDKMADVIRIKGKAVASAIKIIRGYALILLITAAELFLGFLVIGVKNPAVVALIIAVLDILPVIGTGTVLIPWAVIDLIVGNVHQAIMLALLYAIISIVRNIIEPKIIGKRLGLPPVIALMSVYIGARLFGLVGIIILPMLSLIVLQYIKSRSKNIESNVYKSC